MAIHNNKKKIAVFANGWSTEFLKMVLEGIRERAFQQNIDIYLFLSYATEIRGESYSTGENSIFKLPDLNEFDGIILFPSTFNTRDAIDYFEEKLKECDVPSISIEHPMKSVDYIGTENYSASFKLARHLIENHDVKSIVYVGGTEDHQDTIERFNAIKDAFSQSGLDIPADNVIYGYYAYQVSRNAIGTWMSEHDYLPDAIMCANDEMALGVCVQLQDMNIRVPEDVVVTGYDCLEVGQMFLPAITSVHRSWDKIGAIAIEHLLDKMAGKKTDSHICLKAKPLYNMSCGCIKHNKKDAIHNMKDIIVSKYTHSRESVLADEMISTLCFEAVEHSNKGRLGDLEVISEIAFKTMKFYNFLYGKVMKVYVNSEYIDLDKEETKLESFSDIMFCACNVDASGAKKTYITKRHNIIKELGEISGDNHFFIFIPIHNLEYSIGFAVFDDTMQHIYDYSFNSASRHITAAVEKIHQSAKLINANMKLKELSEKDNLTGVYNRSAYDSYAIPLINDLKKQGKNSSLMIVDIDRMKYINDQYGHLQGDVAIKVVAEMLTEHFASDWKIIRYGGDEFVLVGESKELYDTNQIADSINKKIAKYISEKRIPFKLSVSVGAVLIMPEDENDIDYYFKEADKSMYGMKNLHHQNMTY